MAGFTKTIIVDGNTTEITGQRYTNIRSAVNYLTNGGAIIVEEFNSSSTGYIIDTSAISLPANVTLIGRGNVLITVQSDTPAFSANGSSRVVISGFRIKADRGASSYSGQLIRFQNTQNCVIEKCTLTVKNPAAGSAGIHLLGTSGTPPTYAEGNIISECVISGDGGNNGPAYGIRFEQYCIRNMVVNNTVFSCNENCVIAGSSTYNTIMSNVFRNSNGSGSFGGLYVWGSHYNAIVGNECTGNSKRGIYLRSTMNCTVEGNVCKGNTLEGIRLGGDSSLTPCQYNALVNNVCSDNSQPNIYLAQLSQYNAVNGNTATTVDSTSNTYGIFEENIVNTDYNVYVGNICNGNRAGNISVNGLNDIRGGNIPAP